MDADNPIFKHLNYKDFFWVLFVFFVLACFNLLASEQRNTFENEQKLKERTENLKKQHEQEFQKTSEKHKKEIQELKAELTEIKTDLLLTQNKLRELKENN
jgi:septal ring factor EnvC (AmiA/AmiB activator)